VEVLLRLAEHENRRVRTRARTVLEAIPAESPGRDLAALKGWWSRGRAAFEKEHQALLSGPLETVGAAVPLAPGETPSTTPECDPYDYLERVRKDGLEVCIVMDNTGSMIPVIAAAKAQAVALLRRLALFVPRVRAGLVTYDDGAYVRTALTREESVLLKSFNRVAASGGGDVEEGVDKGLRLALRQEKMGWSKAGWRVLVVVGDAPPHEPDVPGLLKHLREARDDDLYDHPVIVHTVSTDLAGVPHFAAIARAGGGHAVTLHDTGRLVEELVALTFGSGCATRIRPWLEEVQKVQDGHAP
jgi:Mg-chelatase subunit ChlD